MLYTCAEGLNVFLTWSLWFPLLRLISLVSPSVMKSLVRSLDGWIPNKQSLSSCRNLNNFIPDEGSRLRNFKPPVCQQTVQRVELICYKHRCFNQKQTMKGREFKTWSEGGYTWIFFSPSHENYWYMWNN